MECARHMLSGFTFRSIFIKINNNRTYIIYWKLFTCHFRRRQRQQSAQHTNCYFRRQNMEGKSENNYWIWSRRTTHCAFRMNNNGRNGELSASNSSCRWARVTGPPVCIPCTSHDANPTEMYCSAHSWCIRTNTARDYLLKCAFVWLT